MRVLVFLSVVFLLITTEFHSLYSAETALTIIHTNDLHSTFLGFPPNSDYTPRILNDDDTLGGWARIASAIRLQKSKRDNPVLVLDAGDFLMGTLFHMVSREEAFELVLMKEIGFDVTTLGNHEFDLRPEGLARILESAARKGKIPQIVSSNIRFSSKDNRDDRLQRLFNAGLVNRSLVIKKGELKIGLFGLMGKDAAQVAPFASPVSFDDPVIIAKKMVKELREHKKVDLVICLSHGGLRKDKSKSEDELLAKAVSGIDVIISGHTHSKLEKPILVNETIIVQAWEYGKEIGVLDLSFSDRGTVKLANYGTVFIDDSIKGDLETIRSVEEMIETINQKVLKIHNLRLDQVLAKTSFDLALKDAESNLGNLLTDATRWAVDEVEFKSADPISKSRLSIQSNGLIRENIVKGKTGFVTVSDLFAVVPLGIGWDGSISYPLVAFYIDASEVKKAFEILTTIYPMKGSNYFLQFSGAKVSYNPNRIPFDRVTAILMENEKGEYDPLDFSNDNKELFKVVSNIYNATFLKLIGDFTFGILSIIPKDRDGNPIENLGAVRVDGDLEQPGIQEIKDWSALIAYVQTFKDLDGDTIPEIPLKYKGVESRLKKMDSLNPVMLISGGNYITWVSVTVATVIVGVLFVVIYLIGLRLIQSLKIKPHRRFLRKSIKNTC